jgi:hypothetical protein
MNRVLFSDVQVFDGSGAECFAGQVLVEGREIAAVARELRCAGATLMPGWWKRMHI